MAVANLCGATQPPPVGDVLIPSYPKDVPHTRIVESL